MSSATIIVDNISARRVAACAGRISTTPGTALELFRAPADEEKDVRLIRKVLSSGHRTVIEHHAITIAFDDVSVLTEQFVIEHRLASYTVKSRRYVDYSGAGFVMPETVPLEKAAEFTERMEYLFDLYTRMVEAGVPKEDARFILPYCFRSNFYCTMNARELAHLICSMKYGRGSVVPEICRLGTELAQQYDAIYPGTLEKMAPAYTAAAIPAQPLRLLRGKDMPGTASLLNATTDPGKVLREAVRFTGRFDPSLDDKSLARAIVRDIRPRELEMLNASFSIEHMSLACLTHLTRHRMLSLLVPNVAEALRGGDFVMPASIEATEGIRDEYRKAFREQTDFAMSMLTSGMDPAEAGYMALSGHEINVHVSMNARELLHFFKLRTCRRAQWEIRGIAEEMLCELCEYSDIYKAFGPSCAVTGSCPEGRLSCGRPVKLD